ncbi:MAG: FAD-dependent oxidoreductase [Thalassobaculaceae bacterium]|nr:FAD-dependent oxidoreductase [Thalassobaculaceae bacterium]
MATRRPVLTRRQLLKGLATIGGAGAAYTALNAMGLLGAGQALAAGNTTEPLPPGSLAGKKIIVIGAGLAGLCTALRAARAGAQVTILEATERAGGRSLTLRNGDSFKEWDWNTPSTMKFEAVGDVPADSPDNYLNAGPGRIPSHHTRLIDYCKELDVALQPYIYHSSNNLMQNDAWNGGQPVQLRRLKNDLRGELAEMLAKVQNQGALDQLVDPSEVNQFLGMLEHFGQLTAEGAELVYQGAAISNDYPRSGYVIDSFTYEQLNPGNVWQPGVPWPTLSLEDVLNSDFWNSEMFNNLEYFWQATLMEPTDGMDKIVDGFMAAPIPTGGTVQDLVRYNAPVRSIDIVDGQVQVTTATGNEELVDFAVPTIAPTILARIDGNFISATVRQILSEVNIAAACKVGLQGKSRFWENEDRIYGGISWTKDIISQIWYPSYSFNSDTGVMTAAYNRLSEAEVFQNYTREQRLEAALAGGEKLHPGYREKVFAENGVSIAWAKMPYQAGGWANETAFTQPDLFAQMASADAIGNKVFFAGDWFSYWPGWQVGALDSAHFATDLIHRQAAGNG